MICYLPGRMVATVALKRQAQVLILLGLGGGSRVGENGIILRPETDKSGPRIDIPAKGDKPHETLHYPK